MSPSLLDFLRHIEHECDFVIRVSKGKLQQEIVNDELLSRGIIRSVEVIGEAVKCIPSFIRNNHHDIPWKSMAGMRDKLIHAYFGVNVRIVWNPVKKELPSVLPLLEKMKDELSE